MTLPGSIDCEVISGTRELYSQHRSEEQWRSVHLGWLSHAWGIFIMNWREQMKIKVIINNEVGKIWKFLRKYIQ